MNIFPPSISRSNDSARCCRRLRALLGVGLLGVGLLALGWTALGGAQTEKKKLPPFLDEFNQNNQPSTVSRRVTISSALGPVKGYLARPDTKEQLPAVLLIHDQAGLSKWMEQNTRELSSIGYVVLAVDLTQELPAAAADRSEFREDERALTKLIAALRWLRRQSDVVPDRIGVVGWSWGAGQALALASSARVQACVLCHGPVSAEASILAGLHGTPVLYIVPGDDANQAHARAFRDGLGRHNIPHKIAVFPRVSAGFMGPPGTNGYVESAAEDAWVEMYEFLGKYVEDADLNQLRPASPKRSVAAIADIMRAANSPTGLRGALIRSLAKEPEDTRAWKQVRAEAALLAEAVALLEKLKPPKGPHSWQEQVHAFQQTALRIVSAADQHDFAAARRRLEQLGNQCAGCHKSHR
jgi:carboxymethylenebutenolidase